MTMSSSQPLSYSAALGSNKAPSQGEDGEQRKGSAPRASKTEGEEGSLHKGDVLARPQPKPNTSQEEEVAYVLTLNTTPEIHRAATDLRMAHFPRHLNKLPAHLTLFHALPESKLVSVRHDLREIAAGRKPFSISISGAKRLRRGVALEVAGMDQAKSIHKELRKRWSPFLSQQDRGGFQAHYTIQNKIDDESVVDKTLQEVRSNLDDIEGEATGLALFQYRKGYWDFQQVFKFSDK